MGLPTRDGGARHNQLLRSRGDQIGGQEVRPVALDHQRSPRLERIARDLKTKGAAAHVRRGDLAARNQSDPHDVESTHGWFLPGRTASGDPLHARFRSPTQRHSGQRTLPDDQIERRLRTSA